MGACLEQNHERMICGEVFSSSKQLATIQTLITVKKRRTVDIKSIITSSMQKRFKPITSLIGASIVFGFVCSISDVKQRRHSTWFSQYLNYPLLLCDSKSTIRTLLIYFAIKVSSHL
jgi:hypothetical protein